MEIEADRAQLFALTQDYTRRLEWDSFLKEARLLNGASAAAVGVRAWCVARASGLGMETEYVTLHAPEVAAVKMTRGPWFLQSFAGSWRFETTGPGWTRVRFRYHLDAAPKWLRPLLNPILTSIFSRETIKRLQALKKAAESADLTEPQARSASAHSATVSKRVAP